MQQKYEIIQQIIKEMYDQNNQSLNLYDQSYHWSDVLLERDWSMLRKLWLNLCRINDETISTILELNWPYLAELSLSDNRLTSKGMHLIPSCSIKNLKQLYLNQNCIGNNGVKYLIKADFPNLKMLNILDCKIGSEGIKHLTKGRWLNLNKLWLGFNQSAKKNKIRLNGWEFIGHGQFQQLEFLAVREAQPICWMCCVLVQKQPKMYENKIKIKNEDLAQTIKKILKDRNLFKESEQ